MTKDNSEIKQLFMASEIDLSDQSDKEEKTSSPFKKKWQKNIKRRVYDSLNVLFAS